MRGYNQSALIAQEIARLLERPCLDLLKKRSGDFPQTGLSREQRESLTSDAITWKKHHPISDKIVLLVDDVMTTGSTLRRCTETLQEAYPQAIYALAFCCSD
jgi:predicted amidophosphoribosyltransferase